MKSVSLSREAYLELTEAAEWYETRQQGLADRFLAELDSIRSSVAKAPQSFPLLAGHSLDVAVRRALLARFPYSLVFFESAREIRIVAVVHSSRRPGYWLPRLAPSP